MRKTGMKNRLIAYVIAAAMVAGSLFAGAGISSEAASYIRYDNIIIRDGANGQIIGGIAKGTEVTIVESATGTDGKQWNHVTYGANGTTHEGWVRADLMTEDKSLIAPDEEPEETEPEDIPEPETPEVTETPEDEEPVVDAELEVVIPLGSVSGTGYEKNGDRTFLVCDKTLTVAEDFSKDKVPADFEYGNVEFGSSTVKGVTCKYGDISLLYLKDDAGEGEFFVWDAAREMVYSYVHIPSADGGLILLVPSEEEVVADSYGRTLYAVDEDTAVVAYQFAQQEEFLDVGANTAEYFYVYGMTKEGIPGWYLIDDGEGTYIRATTDLSVSLGETETDEEVVPANDSDNSLEKMIIVVMAAIILVLFVLMIVFGVRSFRARRGYYEEEDDYEEEEEEMGFIERRRVERKYRRFMENFEEEGDEDVADLLPKKKADSRKAEAEPEAEVSGEADEPVKKDAALETTVLPPVDTVVLKEIMAEQEQAEKELEAEKRAEEAQAAREKLEQAVTAEMAMDDYDVQVEDGSDYDLTDENTEADEKEYDEIESILLAGLAELETFETEAQEIKAEPTVNEEPDAKEDPEEETETAGKEENAEKKEEEPLKEEDEWKDLEFLEI